MKKLIATLALGIAVLLYQAAPAFACSSQTICYGNGRCVFCTTCCVGNYCTTNCM